MTIDERVDNNIAIELVGLRKVFGVKNHSPGLGAAVRQLFSAPKREVVAVDDISFSIERGERVAFVGPNGAGKSTTLKMLSGILYPTAGEIRVLGHVPWKERRALGYRIGTVFGQRSQLWSHLPASDTFELLARVYDLDRSYFEKRRDYLSDIFEIGSYLGKSVRQLSLGERMRCEVVASLLHSPEILFLDEPTVGLDVTARAVIRDLIREESEREGRTVLLTSHDTGDMERVCDRVIVINHGRLLIDQPIEALRSSFIRRKRITVQTAEPSIDISLPGVTVEESSPHRTSLEVDTNVTRVDAVVAETLRQTNVQDLTIEDPSMEEIVQAIYDRPERFYS